VKIRVLFTGLLVLSGSAATGQEYPVVLSQEVGNRQGSPQAFYSMQEFANCIEKRFRPTVAEYLATSVSTSDSENSKAATKLLKQIDSCYTTFWLKTDTAFLRGALIQAAYNDLARGGSPFKLGAPQGAPMGQSISFAQCVVTRRPADSKQLVSTQIASRQEKSMLNKLQPDLNSCAINAGVRTIYPQLFRYQVAEELYREATHQPLAGSQSLTANSEKHQ